MLYEKKHKTLIFVPGESDLEELVSVYLDVRSDIEGRFILEEPRLQLDPETEMDEVQRWLENATLIES